MAKQPSRLMEYETRCDFLLEDDRPAHYIIYLDKIETTCRRCGQQHRVSDKFADKARTNNDILKNALCSDCWREEQKIEKSLEREEKNNSYSNRAGTGQAINLFVLSGGKSPKDFGTSKQAKKIISEWIEFTEEIQTERNG